MTMAHIAFLPLPAHGHVTPALPVAAELADRGHRVTFATTAEFAGAVAGTGATPVCYESSLAGKAQPARFTADYMAREPLRCIEESIAITPLLEQRIGGAPDLYAYDVSTFPTGRALARKSGRPGVQLFPVFASNERYSFGRAQAAELDDPVPADHPAIAEFLGKVADFAGEHGLGGAPESLLAPCDDANLVFLPERFQLNAEAFDGRHAFVGACLPAREPETQWRPPANGEPLALISLGTTFNDNAGFFRRCADAFADLPWQVVLTLGGRVDPADLGPLPGNVAAYRWVPHTAVLRHADVFACHAGMGTMMEALSFATPLVLVPPEVTEHRMNARRAVELGLGRMLASGSASAEDLRDTMLAVAADPAIRSRTTEMRDVLRAAGGTGRAADFVEARLRRG